jgi:hypothetical protein
MLHNFDSAAPRALFAGPGHWNDPDLLEIGNGAFDRNHLVEARAHLSLWAILAAPLMLSYDLTVSSPELLEIVKNPEVIGIDQDPAGNQGVILAKTEATEIIYKSLARRGSKAVALINRETRPVTLTLDLADLHLSHSAPTRVRDVWEHQEETITGGTLQVELAPHQTALLQVEGTPQDRNTYFLDEMPSQVEVIESGSKQYSTPATADWVPAQVGFLPSGEPISVAGVRDTAGIGVAPGSRLIPIRY